MKRININIEDIREIVSKAMNIIIEGEAKANAEQKIKELNNLIASYKKRGLSDEQIINNLKNVMANYRGSQLERNVFNVRGQRNIQDSDYSLFLKRFYEQFPEYAKIENAGKEDNNIENTEPGEIVDDNNEEPKNQEDNNDDSDDGLDWIDKAKRGYNKFYDSYAGTIDDIWNGTVGAALGEFSDSGYGNGEVQSKDYYKTGTQENYQLTRDEAEKARNWIASNNSDGSLTYDRIVNYKNENENFIYNILIKNDLDLAQKVYKYAKWKLNS